MERRSPNDGALAYSNEDSQATSTEKLSEQLNDEDVLHALVGNVAYVWRQDAVDQWDRIERKCHTEGLLRTVGVLILVIECRISFFPYKVQE